MSALGRKLPLADGLLAANLSQFYEASNGSPALLIGSVLPVLKTEADVQFTVDYLMVEPRLLAPSQRNAHNARLW